MCIRDSLIALSAVIFTGILVLMVFALALTANGMITLPSAFLRIIGKGLSLIHI